MATTSVGIPTWTGKALGAAAALVFAPPNPAALAWWLTACVAVGHGLDALSGQTSPRTRPGRPRGHRSARRASLRFTFAALGRLAAASGQIEPEHRRHAEQLMSRLAFTPERRREALGWFDAGRDPAFPFDSLTTDCRDELAAHPVFQDLAMQSLCRMAALADTPRATAELQRLGGLLGWHRDVLAAAVLAVAARGGGPVEHAREVLGVREGDSAAVIRLAYRRRIARWHPDRLPAEATPEERAAAEERVWRLREALEVLLGPG